MLSQAVQASNTDAYQSRKWSNENMKNSMSKLAMSISGLVLGAMLFTSCVASSPVVQPPVTDAPASEAPANPEEVSETAGQYIPYGAYESTADEFSDTNVVLFFNAAWCSTCKVARDNFESSLDQIPSDLTIVVVDFDNATELRKLYGVTVQHTFVQIDASGEAIGKWSGSTTINEIVDQLI
jgi:thiol-disulfide isomerase/thioredoxin